MHYTEALQKYPIGRTREQRLQDAIGTPEKRKAAIEALAEARIVAAEIRATQNQDHNSVDFDGAA